MKNSRLHSIAMQRGSTLIGFIFGLVLGLVIAVIVALMITKGPVPFVNKVGHNGPLASPTDDSTPNKVPDPNKSLYSKDTPGAVVLPPVPTDAAASSAAPATAPTNTTTTATAPAPVIRTDMPDGKLTYLQAGAFKNNGDAENAKAKLALLGFEAQIAIATINGDILYRVRLGPYGRIDDLNRVRQRLTENSIDATVVPAGP